MNKVEKSRRNFLRAAGLGSAGAAAAVILAPMIGQAKSTEKAEEPEGKGYHLTDHIRKYYETARR